MGSKTATSKKIKRAGETPVQRVIRIARAAGVPDAQIDRGGLAETTIVDLSGELGDGKQKMVKVIVNRGGTALDRWMLNDKAGLFKQGEQNAIRYCQNLWARAEGQLRAVDPSADRVDDVMGWAQQEAIVELKRLQARIPEAYWQCYENVCRWDEEAGAAGSNLANNSRSAIDAAKTTVAFTASLIAMWRRL